MLHSTFIIWITFPYAVSKCICLENDMRRIYLFTDVKTKGDKGTLVMPVSAEAI